jgi:hypothetical protein
MGGVIADRESHNPIEPIKPEPLSKGRSGRVTVGAETMGRLFAAEGRGTLGPFTLPSGSGLDDFLYEVNMRLTDASTSQCAGRKGMRRSVSVLTTA